MTSVSLENATTSPSKVGRADGASGGRGGGGERGLPFVVGGCPWLGSKGPPSVRRLSFQVRGDLPWWEAVLGWEIGGPLW